MKTLKLFLFFSLALFSLGSIAGTLELAGHPDRVHHAAKAAQVLGHKVSTVHEDPNLGNVIKVRGPSGYDEFTLSKSCISKMKQGVVCENGQPVGTMCELQNDAVNSVAYVRKVHVQQQAVPVTRQPEDDFSDLLALASMERTPIKKYWYEEMFVKAAPAALGAAGYWAGQRENRRGLENRNPDVFNQTLKNGNFNNSSTANSRAHSSSNNHIVQNTDVVLEGGNPGGPAPDDGANPDYPDPVPPGPIFPSDPAPDDGANPPANPGDDEYSGGGAPDDSGGSNS